MKVSSKLKAFCYACLNVGALGWSLVLLLEDTAPQRIFVIFLTYLVMMNA